jgi:CBS domain-containing membrane protein
LLGHGAIACGIAVGLAIALMSVCRCLHPPGGAAALLAALAVGTGISFAAAPVAADAAVLVCAGWVYHRFSGHS